MGWRCSCSASLTLRLTISNDARRAANPAPRHNPGLVHFGKAQVTEHDPEAVTRHDLEGLEKAMNEGFKNLRERMDTRFTDMEKAGALTAKEIERRQREMNEFREEARKDSETYVRYDLYRTERRSDADKMEKVEEKLNGELKSLRALIGTVALLLIATLAGVVVDIATR